LGVEVLYALSAPDVPPEVRAEVVERAKSEPVTLGIVRDRLREVGVVRVPERTTSEPIDRARQLVRHGDATEERGALRERLESTAAPWEGASTSMLPVVDLETGAPVADPDIQDDGDPDVLGDYATGTDWLNGLEEEHAAFLAEHVPPILARLAAYRADPAARDEIDELLAEYVADALSFLHAVGDLDEERMDHRQLSQRKEYRHQLELYVAVSVALGRRSLPGA